MANEWSNHTGNRDVLLPVRSNGYGDNRYSDFLHVPFDTLKQQLRVFEPILAGPRCGVSKQFPVKLYTLLARVSSDGISHIISWKRHGRAFEITNPNAFTKEVMPK